jgi:acetylornithine deacetylase
VAPRGADPCHAHAELSDLTRIRQAVENGLPAAVELLRELVRVPSTLGEEEPAQELVERRLVELGFGVRSVEPNAVRLAERADSGIPLLDYEGRRSLVGTLEGGYGRSLLLNGHVDVVSAEPLAHWTRDPWGGEIEGDRLYGRGSGDMKGGVVAMLLAVEAARSLGDLPGRVVYQSVIEEECGGNGALAACLAGPLADGVVIAEPTGGELEVVAPGVIWARLTFETPSGHAQSADERTNPIEAAFAAVAALRALERELNATPEAEFQGIAAPYLLNVGMLHAGDWPSTSPGIAELDVRLGFPIRMEPAEAQARLAAAVQDEVPDAGIEFRGFRARGYAFEEDTAFATALSGCHEDVHGARPCVEAGRATTDLRWFHPGQAACYGPTSSGSHAVDEWVSISSIADVATVLALLLRRWG